ncbi:Major Facilitator Superfamily protein [Brevibacterium aurantiacum]|uniref:Major Facilitator Superfamily protein n=1 Tax=Brevibacterium aurantiacum TaxID=273384 RepID=A0A2H1JVI4_BREAU|nr:MFS transporter [Brevibacterium aurantiacum]SMX91052.1 Major Facilitator Superfamily protein [Brevibacterium aurantiacum]
MTTAQTSPQKTDAGQLKMVRKAAIGSAVGTTIEAYDFQIYGVASALVFSTVFFSDVPSSLGVVFSFATLSVGFLARPFGAIIFGHYGDRVGRKTLLVTALMGAGGCTTVMGMLPTTASVGIWAPILLVFLRLLQGIFHGGEQGGAVLMAVEHAPAEKRGWYGSWTFLGSPGGTLLAAGVMGVVTAATGDNFLTWGWRIPFLLSFLLLGVGLIIRFTVTESPKFAKVKSEEGKTKAPLIQVIQKSWKFVLISIGVNLGFNAFIWVLISYSLAYGTEYLSLPRELMLRGTQIGSVVMIISILVFARLSDKIGRTPVMFFGAAFLVIYPFPMFALLNTAEPVVVVLALVIGFCGSSAVFGPLAAFLVELFPTKVAYSGVSVGYSLGAVLGGGLAPFIASLLMNVSGGQSWTVSLYLTLAGLISFISMIVLRRIRTSDKALNLAK